MIGATENNMDLDKLFSPGYNYGDFLGYTFIHGKYKIDLWVGICNGDDISDPPVKHLSLNEYSHFGFVVKHQDGNYLKLEEMHNLFGFDFNEFPLGKLEYKYPNYGYLIPKSYLIKILQKLGAIPSIPYDWGDGE